jgi:tripartite-type tricarboxylate transporter receptor subunit TctC
LLKKGKSRIALFRLTVEDPGVDPCKPRSKPETAIVINRRTWALGTAASFAVGVGGEGARAQGAANAYPSKPVRFYPAFPPGGSTDIVARIVAPPLSARLDQPVIIDNRAGAGGTIGVDAVARSAPDGYTIGFGVSGALTSSATLMRLPYDPLRDLAPVSLVALNPLVLLVPQGNDTPTLKDLIERGRRGGPPLRYGTPGAGTAMHLAGELLGQMSGMPVAHIAYKGSSLAASDLLGGHIDAAIIDLATARPHLKSGRFRALGTTSARRSQLAPEIATIAEAGVPGYEFDAWFALIMAAGTPAAIVSRMNTELTAVLRDPATRQQLMDAGVEPAPGTPAELEHRIRTELESTRRIIQSAGIRLE